MYHCNYRRNTIQNQMLKLLTFSLHFSSLAINKKDIACSNSPLSPFTNKIYLVREIGNREHVRPPRDWH